MAIQQELLNIENMDLVFKPVQVNGLKIYPFQSFDELLNYVLDKKGILIAINARKILKATDQTRSIINRNIGYCDGVGAAAALKKHGCKGAVKLPGCELWLKIISVLKDSKTFYLVGGQQEVIDTVIHNLNVEFPGIKIVGYRNGYFSDQEKNVLIEDIKHKKPDVVFVAMGSPKQELLMEELFQNHPAIYQGLGGSFDVYSGKVKRAPKWWIDHNLEGVYRGFSSRQKIVRFMTVIPFWWKLLIGKI